MPNLNHLNSFVPAGITPRYVSIAQWCEISGVGRTVTYQLLGEKVLKAVKIGRRTLIDLEHGLRWMASLPPAHITVSKHAD